MTTRVKSDEILLCLGKEVIYDLALVNLKLEFLWNDQVIYGLFQTGHDYNHFELIENHDE
jgi:hypothetical protein